MGADAEVQEVCSVVIPAEGGTLSPEGRRLPVEVEIDEDGAVRVEWTEPSDDSQEKTMPKGSINGVPYDVPDGFRVVSEAEIRRARDAVTLLSDLSRSKHGRHEGDAEFQTPGGVSLGNDLLTTGQQVGYTIDGSPIIVPSHRERGNPDAWKRGAR